MADTPEQAKLRAQLRARGDQLAPRVSEGRANGNGAAKPAPAKHAAPSAGTRTSARKAGPVKTARKVAAGAVEGGPAGAGRAAVKSRLEGMQRGGRAPAGRHRAPAGAPRAQPRTAGYRGRHREPLLTRERAKRAGGLTLKGGKKLTGRASGGVLLAEYFLGAFIIVASLFTKGPNQGYLQTMTEILARLTALTAVFFVLFLMAGSENAGKFAAWFGLLIDIGILFTATREAEISTLTDVITGKGTGVEPAALTAALDVPDAGRTELPE